MIRREREREEAERARLLEEERIKKEIIEEERQRLLREFAPHVADFLPKGTLRDDGEKQYVYRN